MRFFRSESGGAAVEFAFLAPILALIVGGIIEVGNLTQTGMMASNAAREGARYISLGDCYNAFNAPVSYLTSALGGRSLSGGNVSIGTVSITSGATTITPQSWNSQNCPPAIGSMVTVNIPVTVSMDMPVVRQIVGTTVTLNGGATMQRYTNP